VTLKRWRASLQSVCRQIYRNVFSKCSPLTLPFLFCSDELGMVTKESLGNVSVPERGRQTG